MQKPSLSSEKQQQIYGKYYSLDLYPAAFGLKSLITGRQLSPENTISITEREKILKCDISDKMIGYATMPDGTGYISTYTVMPHVTPEMIDWWFVWHGQESGRYVIWDKEDHYSVKSTQLERLTDASIPMNERIWGVTHTVLEDTGCGPEEIVINFRNPAELFKPEDIQASPVKTIIWGNGSTAVMCHTVFPNPEGTGIILASHFWLGYNVKEDGSVVKLIPDGIQIPEMPLKGLSLHSIKEYANLGHFLPYLYSEIVEGKKVRLLPVYE